MNQSWAHEIFIDEGLATRLIKNQFDFNITSFTDLGHDWDNAAFLVNEEYVFRFPRRLNEQLEIIAKAGAISITFKDSSANNSSQQSEEIWLRAKLWALYSATAICWYGHDANVKDLKREGQMALEFIKEETT